MLYLVWLSSDSSSGYWVVAGKVITDDGSTTSVTATDSNAADSNVADDDEEDGKVVEGDSKLIGVSIHGSEAERLRGT